MALKYCKRIPITRPRTESDALVKRIHWDLAQFFHVCKIPELNDDAVFVLAQNSADMAGIDAKNSSCDNEDIDSIKGDDTIDPTSPLHNSPDLVFVVQ